MSWVKIWTFINFWNTILVNISYIIVKVTSNKLVESHQAVKCRSSVQTKCILLSLIWWIAPSNKTWSEFWINLPLRLYIYNILFHYKALNSALNVHCLFQWVDGSVGLHEGIHFSAQHSHVVRRQHQDPAATLNTSLHQNLRKTRANWHKF